ncbi:MAG: sigma-70 family RNA polymerase sigma factor [Acidobacteria bacterium]|nr:sigma-70 family RNA polymerase sigma factor [Acidobacteriota bacterium]
MASHQDSGGPVDSIPSLIGRVESGDNSAAPALFDALYTELHRLAGRELRRVQAGGSLSVTTLLHEAYLDMAKRDGATFPDRARFMAYAGRVMRGLIIDHARNRRALRRGGAFAITSVDGLNVVDVAVCRELTEVSDALDELGKVDPSLVEVVDLKFFCGFSFGEIAELRGLSERTVQRRWEKARIYLYSSIRGDLPE